LFDDVVDDPPLPDTRFKVMLLWTNRDTNDVTEAFVEAEWSIEHLKTIVREQEGLAPDTPLQLKDESHRILNDDETVQSCNILDGDIVRVLH
jgi:hypothetical protein